MREFMARIIIELPKQLPFRTELELRISEINYGGHLGNDSVLTLVHESRIRYLAALGFTELDIGGASLIMADVGIVYRSEGFHGDRLAIEVGPGEITSRGVDLYFRLLNQKTGKEVAIAKTGMLAFDYTSRKVTKLPEVFLTKLNSSIEIGSKE
jgi:acyl-CoA thioesterase FadM